MKPFKDELSSLLKKHFDHDVVYVSQERREEALTAILNLIKERVPEKKQVNAPIDANEFGGYNDAIDDFSKNLGVGE